MNYKSDIEDLVAKTSALTNKPLILGTDFTVIHQPLYHKPLPLPQGKIAVYTFVYNGEFLKIGRAGVKSKPRYQSHHYHIKSGKSTLANRLINDPSMQTLVNQNNVTQWIKDNCERFDVIIDAKFGNLVLNYIEGLLHYQYKPRYEG